MIEDVNTTSITTGKEMGITHHERSLGCEPAIHDNTVGTVQLYSDDEIVLLPTPSRDPRDPLNLPQWHKWIIVFTVGTFSVTGVLLASGIGAVLPIIEAEYHGDPRTSDLVVYPSLFMGIGNILFIPITHAIGRRPVFLLSNVIMIVGCIWCAISNSLDSHIAGRDFMALGAGQTEALCPIIIQEISFLHERATRLSWIQSIQTLGVATLIIASSYLSASYGWRWWYGLFAIVNFVTFMFTILFVVETKFDRPHEALTGEVDVDVDGEVLARATTRHRPEMDLVNFKPRTWLNNMKPWHGFNDWRLALSCWKQMLQVIWFPNVFYLLLCNSIFLSIYIIFGAVFAGLLVSPPWSFGYSQVGFIFAGQIPVAFIAVPLLGWCGDYVVKFMSRRNNGIMEPEFRLIPSIIPFIATIIATVIFGQAASDREKWSWAGVVVPFSVEYFGFVGIVVTSFTYIVDSYPNRSDPMLVVLCGGRGFIGFGVSFAAISFINKTGYNGAMNICAIIVGVLAAVGVVIYFTGKKIRAFTQKWAQD